MKRSLQLLSITVFIILTSCTRLHGPAARIAVTMKKYEFVPAEIHVKQGQRVVLAITTADVQHGFKVADWDINEPVQKGKTTEVEFVAGKPGRYRMNCSIICGPMHDDMEGAIVVE